MGPLKPFCPIVCVCVLRSPTVCLALSSHLLLLPLDPANTRQCVYVINCSRTMSAEPKPIDNTGTFVASHDRPVVFQRDCHRMPCRVYDSFHFPLSFSFHFLLADWAGKLEPTATNKVPTTSLTSSLILKES